MAADCISIIYNQNQQLTDWVCQGLNIDTSWLNRYMTLGVQYHGKTIAALIYHDIKPTQELSWTIYSTDKHWCTKKVIKEFMRIAFEVFKCRRINLLVTVNNTTCLNFVTRLGFQIEGRLREYREDGQDCYILSLLKSENKYK